MGYSLIYTVNNNVIGRMTSFMQDKLQYVVRYNFRLYVYVQSKTVYQSSLNYSNETNSSNHYYIIYQLLINHL